MLYITLYFPQVNETNHCILITQSELIPIPSKFVDAPYSADKASILHSSLSVAGVDYRFGFRAAGKASDLVQLCEKYGLQSAIVDPVMDAQKAGLPIEIKGKEKGQVSTTGIRKALAEGDVKHAEELLGRPHRLFISTDGFTRSESLIHLPVANALNQPPKSGSYKCRIAHEDSEVSTDSEPLLGKLHIKETDFALELPDLKLVDTLTQQSHIAIDIVR